MWFWTNVQLHFSFEFASSNYSCSVHSSILNCSVHVNNCIDILYNENPRTSELAPSPNYDSAFENISETGNDFTNDRLPTYEEALKMWSYYFFMSILYFKLDKLLFKTGNFAMFCISYKCFFISFNIKVFKIGNTILYKKCIYSAHFLLSKL